MRATLKDIAAAAGVSQVAVSCALRGKAGISEQTRSRVIAIARQLRYRPNGMAKSMRDGRTGIVGLIYSTDRGKGSMPLEQLGGIQQALSSNAFDLMLAEIPRDNLSVPGTASSLLRHWMADGLLINHQIDLPESVVEMVDGDQVPAVWINTKQSHNCVYFDEFDAGRRAVEHLLALGHRRIAYLDYSHPSYTQRPPEHYSAVDRYAGYLAGLNRAGLPPRLIMTDEGVVGGFRVAACRAFLSQPDRPTAVITYSGTNSVPLLFAAQELGLRVPQDLSIIDFAGGTAPATDIRLTLMLQSYRLLGEHSARKLINLLGAEMPSEEAKRPIAIPLSLEQGASTAPAATR